MFCLKQPKDGSISYYNLNRGSVTDTEMEEMLGNLLSLFLVNYKSFALLNISSISSYGSGSELRAVFSSPV